MDGRMAVLSVMLVSLLQAVSCSDLTYWSHVCSAPNILACPKGYRLLLAGVYEAHTELACPDNQADSVTDIATCSKRQTRERRIIRHVNDYCRGANVCFVYPLTYAMAGEQILNCSTDSEDTTAFTAYEYRCIIYHRLSHVYRGTSKNLTCPEGYTFQLTGAYCVIEKWGCPKNVTDKVRSIDHCYSLLADTTNGYIRKKSQICNEGTACEVNSMSFCETVDHRFMAFGYKCHLDPAIARNKPSIQILDVYDSPERTTTAPRITETATSSFDGNVHVPRTITTGVTTSDNDSSPRYGICSQDNYTGIAVGTGVGGLLLGLVVGAGAVFWFRRRKTDSVSNDHTNDTTMDHHVTTPIPAQPNGHNHFDTSASSVDDNAADAQISADAGDYEAPDIYGKLNSAEYENDCPVYEGLKAIGFRRRKTDSVSSDHTNDVDTTMDQPNGRNHFDTSAYSVDAQHSADVGDYEAPNIYGKLNSAEYENDCRVYEGLKHEFHGKSDMGSQN